MIDEDDIQNPQNENPEDDNMAPPPFQDQPQHLPHEAWHETSDRSRRRIRPTNLEGDNNDE